MGFHTYFRVSEDEPPTKDSYFSVVLAILRCMDTLSGEETLTLLFFISLLQLMGQLLNESICSFRSKYFPLRIDPLERLCCSGT